MTRVGAGALPTLGLALSLALPLLGGGAADAKPKRAATGAEALQPAPVRTAPSESARDVVQRESKIEFDERLVQGQTAAGAIYLFQRGESEYRSLIKPPDSFRDRTVKKLFPDGRP